MFYLNNNDMEHWFKEAAEKFEPDTQHAADWPRIQAALHNEPSSKDRALPIAEKKKRRRFVFWWFFLLPAAGLVYYGISKFGNDQQQAPVAGKEKATISNAITNKPAQPGNNNSSNNNTVMGDDLAKQGSILPAQENNAASKSTITAEKGSTGKQDNDPFTLQHLQEFKDNLSISRKDGMIASNTNKQSFENNSNKNSEPTITADNNSNFTNQSIINKGETVTNNDSKDAVHAESTTTTAVTTEKQEENKNLLQPKDSATASPVKKITAQKSKFFYTGVVLGADESFIKGQRTDGLGSSFGILFGYSLNKRWKIETGVAYDTKKYYTKGQFFDKSNFWYLQNANLLAVDGNCHMFEIPVNVRYNIYNGKKLTWFASAGASSYIMHKEYYNYKFIYNGTYGERDYDYYNSTRNWFSVMNISAGLETKLGNAGDLRIEPYMRVPMAGVGKGNISLSSAGLYVGLTRRIP